MWHEPNMKKDPWEGGGGGSYLGTSIPICDTVFYRLFYLLTLGDIELQTNNYCKWILQLHNFEIKSSIP